MSRAIIKAVTLWPEWAWAYCHLDKDGENRTWRWPAELVGHYVAIHAGAYVGGRKARVATREALFSLSTMASRARWVVESEPEEFPGSFRPGLAFNDGRGHGRREVFDPRSCPTSAVVAVGRVARVVAPGPPISPWHVPDCFFWYTPVDEVVVLPEPVAIPGQRGLWDLPERVLGEVRDQARAARQEPRSRRRRPEPRSSATSSSPPSSPEL